jgi:hypothetical protein
VANWRKQLGGMDPLKPVILNNSSCACLAFAFQSSIYLIVDICLSHVQCRLFCKCASVQCPNHCTEVSASIFTSPSSKNDTGICYLVHVDKCEADVSTWILTALTAWMLWQALQKKEQGPIAIHRRTRIQSSHARWTYYGHFLGSLKATALKLWKHGCLAGQEMR